MKVPRRLISVFTTAETFLLVSHMNPDGDALGSALALGKALATMGKRVHILNRDPVPDFYGFLPGSRRIRATAPKGVMEGRAVLVLLDCNSPKRTGMDALPHRLSVVIDHHETESGFGDVRWVDPSAAATGVLIYHLLNALQTPLSKDIATNLYAALCLDTGTFRYRNTGAEVLRIGAALVDAGADPAYVAESLYESWSERRFRLLQSTLKTLEMRDGLAMMHVTRAAFRNTGTDEEDTENFSNFPRRITTVALAALLRQRKDGGWKVSLRSKGSLNAARIAEAFGGGGHRNAAGYMTATDLGSAKKALEARYREVSGRQPGHPRPRTRK